MKGLVWYMIWQVITLPFRFLWSFTPMKRFKDYKLNQKLRDLIDELSLFALFMNKGPVNIKQYNMQSIIKEFNCELEFLSSEHNKMRRVWFMNPINSNHIGVNTGSNSGGGRTEYKKDNFEFMMYDCYRYIESVTLNSKKDRWAEYKNWQSDILFPILHSYGLDTAGGGHFYWLRRALIMLTHNNHERSEQAYKDLLKSFGNEQKVFDFVKKIEGAYSVKIAMEILEG